MALTRLAHKKVHARRDEKCLVLKPDLVPSATHHSEVMMMASASAPKASGRTKVSITVTA